MRRTVARLVDAGVGAVGLLVFAPLMLLISALILLEDGSPVVYRQKRLGLNAKPFFILKFRSMHSGAKGPSITSAGDRRITNIGRHLRKLKLDELPQLLNVLRGEMSLIGPRPELPEFVDLDDALWRQVLTSPAGITDLASLAFRNEERILNGAADPEAYYRESILPDKLRLNVHYQSTRTVWTDVKLLWLTGRYSFFPQGYDRQRILRSFNALKAASLQARVAVAAKP